MTFIQVLKPCAMFTEPALENLNRNISICLAVIIVVWYARVTEDVVVQYINNTLSSTFSFCSEEQQIRTKLEYILITSIVSFSMACGLEEWERVCARVR